MNTSTGGGNIRIDNSGANAWRKCPASYFEKHEKGIERNWEDPTALDFGKRVHQLLEEHYLDLAGRPRAPYPEHANDAVELEAQALIAAYRNQYPVEDFEVVDVERVFEIPLCGGCDHGLKLEFILVMDGRWGLFQCPSCGKPARHTYRGKMDAVVRDRESGQLEILEHKTQSRSSLRNHPEAWAARSQASLYIWAGEQIYGEPFRDILLNVLKRQSPKGQIGPEFPPRQRLQRTEEQKAEAVRDIVWVADQIEQCQRTGVWPKFTESCKDGNFSCDFYQPHTYGWSDELLHAKFKPAEKYLDM